MALEEELMDTAKEEAVEQEEHKNVDDLTDEEVEAVKALVESAGWEVLKKCMKIRIEKQEEDIVNLARDHFMDPKKMGYTCFEVLGAFVKGMGEMERLANVLTADPEKVKEAIDMLNKAEENIA